MHNVTRIVFPRAARSIALLGLVTASACDSLPNSIGPTAADLLSTFAIWNDAPAAMTQVLVHPTTSFGGCNVQNDSTLDGGVAEFTTRTGEGRNFNLETGCYLFFVRFEGHPGHVQAAASLGPDDYKSTRISALPAVPEQLTNSATLRIENGATRHTAPISRIYIDPCRAPGTGIYGQGAGGGATRDLVVNVEHGASTTVSLPATCQIITILWSNGFYQFGTYNLASGSQVLVGR